jgi:uncharacterized membrane protein
MANEPLSKSQAVGLAFILTIGFAAVVSEIAEVAPLLEPVSDVVAIFGFFVVIPIVWFFAEQLPYVAASSGESTSGGSTPESTGDPVDEIRRRYAVGEIDEAEFERRLDLLVETEDASPEEAYDALQRNTSRDQDRGRTEPEFD